MPSEMSVSIEAAPWRAFASAARWNGQPAQAQTGVGSASATHSHPSKPNGGTMAISATGTVRIAATASRRPRSKLSRAPSARSVSLDARAVADALHRRDEILDRDARAPR